MTSNDIPWLAEARQHIGLREIPGAPTAPTIQRWLSTLGAWWTDDETPWCGVAVAAWMQSADIKPPPNWFRARAWLDFGMPLIDPVVGCVVVFGREGGGHVGLVTGVDQRGRLLVLGGNQGNAVSEAPFERERVLGYRWPPNQFDLLARLPDVLPIRVATGASSRNEA